MSFPFSNQGRVRHERAHSRHQRDPPPVPRQPPPSSAGDGFTNELHANRASIHRRKGATWRASISRGERDGPRIHNRDNEKGGTGKSPPGHTAVALAASGHASCARPSTAPADHDPITRNARDHNPGPARPSQPTKCSNARRSASPPRSIACRRRRRIVVDSRAATNPVAGRNPARRHVGTR